MSYEIPRKFKNADVHFICFFAISSQKVCSFDEYFFILLATVLTQFAGTFTLKMKDADDLYSEHQDC